MKSIINMTEDDFISLFTGNLKLSSESKELKKIYTKLKSGKVKQNGELKKAINIGIDVFKKYNKKVENTINENKPLGPKHPVAIVEVADNDTAKLLQIYLIERHKYNDNVSVEILNDKQLNILAKPGVIPTVLDPIRPFIIKEIQSETHFNQETH
ncbi:hypothetical protein ACN5ZK_13260 (plasmid) [Macrococcoides bohemicum]|uniref:hypothetical protein n=1 Tax=Macrococcoides bohemicum TaxID=1903056 RepID=UPI003B00A912